jgi:hypothetical protein
LALREADEATDIVSVDVDDEVQPDADIGNGAHADFSVAVTFVLPKDGRIPLDVRRLRQRNAVLDRTQRIFEQIEGDRHFIYRIHK